MILRDLIRSVLPAETYARLARLRERLTTWVFIPFEHTGMYGGVALRLLIADRTAKRWYTKDWPMPPEILLLRDRGKLQTGATVFDLGAHQGVVACLLASMVGNEGRVIAVEPNSHNFEVLIRNQQLNPSIGSRILPRCQIAAERVGELPFDNRLNGAVVASVIATRLPATTVDCLMEEMGPPSVLFIDVEGYEVQVLGGAAETLRRACPDIFVEVHVGAGLEQNGSLSELLVHIPKNYALFVAAADVQTPDRFLPMSQAPTRLLESRFLLVGIAS